MQTLQFYTVIDLDVDRGVFSKTCLLVVLNIDYTSLYRNYIDWNISLLDKIHLKYYLVSPVKFNFLLFMLYGK